MKKFSYRMENILNIKLQMEEQQKVAFALASNALEEEKDKLSALSNRQKSYERRFKELLRDDLDLAEIASTRRGIDQMKVLVREQMFNVVSAEKKLDVERKKLYDIRVERKTQEKLKEYAFEAYKKEYAMEEAREIDQTVSYTYSADRDSA